MMTVKGLGSQKKSAERRIFMESLAGHQVRHHKLPKFPMTSPI
jgi:hypothetical protein